MTSSERHISQRLRRNKGALFGLIVIGSSVLIAIFCYFLAPDGSPDANRIIVEIGGKSPGFRQLFLPVRKERRPPEVASAYAVGVLVDVGELPPSPFALGSDGSPLVFEAGATVGASRHSRTARRTGRIGASAPMPRFSANQSAWSGGTSRRAHPAAGRAPRAAPRSPPRRRAPTSRVPQRRSGSTHRRRVRAAESEDCREQHDHACPLGSSELSRQRTPTGTAGSADDTAVIGGAGTVDVQFPRITSRLDARESRLDRPRYRIAELSGSS